MVKRDRCQRSNIMNAFGALCAGAVLVSVIFSFTQAVAGGQDSCITCHSNPDFAVINKKIRKYYLKWEHSSHADAGVICSDCHGGNPAETDKNKAHAGKKDSIYFTDIPKTCGNCHDDIYKSYIQSEHYKYLEKPDRQMMHGANCVTCHAPGDPFMGMTADPENVEKSCELCHNYKTGNFPDIPEKAMLILVKFNAIKQQFNNLVLRTANEPSQEVINVAKTKIKDLSAAWHSFNLELAGKKTDEVLALLKDERKRLRKIRMDNIYKKGKKDPLYGY